MNSYHRKTFDPPKTSPVRKTQWIAPKREGHRVFLVIPKPHQDSPHD